MQRISVVGTSGSGKTTLACQIAQTLHYPHVELDALHWQPNWTEAPDELFHQRVAQALAGDRWVVDGNYSKVRDLVWGRADTVVFLDYGFWLVLGQLLRRTLERSLGQTELWNGNRESFRTSFFSQNSILLWMLQTHAINRAKYPLLFQRPEYRHLKIVQLRFPQQTQAWLEQISVS